VEIGKIVVRHGSNQSPFQKSSREMHRRSDAGGVHPAQATGKAPIEAWTDIAMFWRLPKQ
jgi:hypothetical protein